VKDKLVIIATIQYCIEKMKSILFDAGRGNASIEKRGALKALGLVLIEMHYAITGDHWQGSPKDLSLWMLRYCKQEADALGKPDLIIVH
jgi:hypothetical protein